jgi:hypothetical protein
MMTLTSSGGFTPVGIRSIRIGFSFLAEAGDAAGKAARPRGKRLGRCP